MSERMREPFHTLMWKASIGYNDSWSQVDPEVLQKFAESIVEECAEYCAELDGGENMFSRGIREKFSINSPQ